MKFSFEIVRNASKSGISGAAIKSVRVNPRDAHLIREYTAHNNKMARLYDAAVTTNLNQDLALTVGSANAENLTSEYMTKGRARTLVKDYPITKGIIRTFKNNVVGDDPFRLEMKVGSWDASGSVFTLDTKTNREIQEAWEDAGTKKNCTVRRDMTRMEMYQIVEASAYRDGGVIGRHHRDFPYNKFKYAVELIEIDRLQSSYMGRSENGNAIRFSIEFDKYNAPTAYYILSRHPGDLFAYNGPTHSNVWRERVPAEDIIHFNNLRDRAEQDIGMSELDSLIQTLHRDRQFDIAHVTAAITACCRALFITRNKPTANEFTGDSQSAEGEKFSYNEPGSAEVLPDGYGIETHDPKFPIEAAESFKRRNMLDVAAGAGLSYGAVTADFEKYSFSSARAAETPQRDYFKVRQEHMIQSFVLEHFENWLRNAILTGVVKQPISRLEELVKAAVFHGKRWPYINPLQDAQTDVILVEAKMKTRGQALAESGDGATVEEVFSGLANENKIAESHHIDLAEFASTPTVKKGDPGVEETPGGQPDDNQPPPKKNGNSRMRLTFNPNGETVTSANGRH
jgi:lambda family phage portal protein